MNRLLSFGISAVHENSGEIGGVRNLDRDHVAPPEKWPRTVDRVRDDGWRRDSASR